jgi:hypothetical protein
MSVGLLTLAFHHSPAGEPPSLAATVLSRSAYDWTEVSLWAHMASAGDLPHLLQYKYLSLPIRIMAYLLLNHCANVSGGLYSFFKVQ